MTDRPEDSGIPAPTPDDAETISGVGPPITDAPEPVASSLIGRKIGAFSLKRIIGSGGMGIVYEAMQEQPRRRVALKMMKRGITSKSALRRFEFESQLLGRLQHPGIAQVYEAGTHDDGSGGVPYFAMEYISSARSLTQYVQEKKLGTRERLALFAKVCDAVQHGHLKGVVHRDLKPDNILVDSSGQPKIIDFGVARSTDSDMAVTTLQTDIGQLVGTIQYMSPEQVEADPSDIDARSDVYAMGVILYELLTNSLPYDVAEAAIHEAVRMVREEEPTKLSTIDRHLRGDVETIALKALEKERERRYQSATALEEDIQRYLDGDPISASRPSAWYHMKRFAQRHKAASIAISTVFTVLVGAVIVILVFAVEAERQRVVSAQKTLEVVAANAELGRQTTAAVSARKEAQQERDAAIEARDEASRQAYFGNIQAAAVALEREYGSSANQRLIDARMAKGTPPISELPFEWQYLNAQANHATMTLGDPNLALSAIVRAIAFSPDGTRLASGGGHDVRLWDTETGEELAPLIGLTGYVGAITFSPDGTRLAAGGADNTIRIWNPRSGEALLTLIGHEMNDRTVIETIAFSPDGTRLAACLNDNTLRLWNPQTGHELAVLVGPELYHPDVANIAFSPDSSRLAYGVGDNSIRILDTATGNEVVALRGHDDTAKAVTFSPDGTQVVSIGSDDTIRIWDPETGEELAMLLWQESNQEEIRSIALSPDGGQLATGGWDGRIRLWDTHTGEAHASLQGHTSPIPMIKFNSDGSRLASAGTDDTVRIWDPRTGEALSTLFGHLSSVWQLAYSPDGIHLASGGRDGTVRIWNPEAGEAVAPLPGHGVPHERGWDFHAVAFSPDGNRLASGGTDHAVRIWDRVSGDELVALRGHEDMVTSVSFSPDGTRLASSSFDGTIRLWDMTNGETLSILRGAPASRAVRRRLADLGGHDVRVYSCTFSPDGTLLASGGGDHAVRLWDSTTGKELSVLRKHVGPVFAVSFSPDGTRLASGSRDSSIMIWDPKTGDEVSMHMWRNPWSNSITDLAYSPDGVQVVTGSYDGNVRIWDVQNDGKTALLRGHHDFVTTVAVSPDGTRVASGSDDGTVRIWDFQTGKELIVLPRGESESNPECVTFNSDGTCLASIDDLGVIRMWRAQSGGQVAEARHLSQRRYAQLSPVVDSWIEKADGDNELVVALLEQGVKNRTPEEATTLRNLVLKKLVQRRQAKKAETTETTPVDYAQRLP